MTPDLVVYKSRKDGKCMLWVYISIFALIFIWLITGYLKLKNQPDGPDDDFLRDFEDGPEKQSLLEAGQRMRNYTSVIRSGVLKFFDKEYKVIVATTLVIVVLITLFLERFAGIKFWFGAAISFAGVFIGSIIANIASVRVTERARRAKSVGKTVKVALDGGKLIGIVAHSFGAFGGLVLYMVAPPVLEMAGHGLIGSTSCSSTIIGLIAYSLGYSLIAMFFRVAGGVLTKMADIGADIVGKVFFDMPEDDARNPATACDNTGDILADAASNVADMGESYVAALVSAFAASVYFQQEMLAAGTPISSALFEAMRQFPLFLAVFGLLSSVIGLIITTKRKLSDKPGKDLNIAMYFSAGAVLIFSLVGSYVLFGNLELPEVFRFGWISPFLAVGIGILSAVAIGKITEYFTSSDYKPVQLLARIAQLGPAFLVTRANALGKKSSMGGIPVILSIVIVYWLMGATYGIPIAALGLMSFIGTTVSIDAFGPISDNAGGITEVCGLEGTREYTDELDEAGNTTAAIGKGFAISGATYSTVSMMSTFASAAGLTVLSIMNPYVLAGLFVAGFALYLFESILGDNTIEGAEITADLCVEQIKSGKADSAKVIESATAFSNRRMIYPVLLCIAVDIIVGVVLGSEAVAGLQCGMVLVALYEALYNGNAGGAMDNAKKMVESNKLADMQRDLVMKDDKTVRYVLKDRYVEPKNDSDKESFDENFRRVTEVMRSLFGKGSEVHKTTVIGDTIGDTMKDVICVCLDIFIKMTATASVILAPIFGELDGNIYAKAVVIGLLLVVAIMVVLRNRRREKSLEMLQFRIEHEIIPYFDRVTMTEEERTARGLAFLEQNDQALPDFHTSLPDNSGTSTDLGTKSDKQSSGGASG